VALGWFIRAMHGWGSNFMVAIVLIHMAQVFLFGAHKFPRELTWIIGVFLLLMTLGMAFTGQVMRFDQDAYWGLGIGASIASRVPILGPAVVKLMLGGPIIAGATLSRFFALHVFVIPGMLIAFVGLHLLMVIKLGINEWPMPGRIVKRATYETQYHALTKSEGAPFVPYAVWKDMFFAAFIILAIAACAYYFGHPDCAQAGLLFPVALCFAFTSPSIAGDAIPSHLPALSNCWSDSFAVSFRRRRKELEAQTHCSRHRAHDRNHAQHVYASCAVHAVESAHERLERRSRTRSIHSWHNRDRAAGCARVPGQAMPQLPCPRRYRRTKGAGSGWRRRATYA
jgi:hypothetical protein